MAIFFIKMFNFLTRYMCFSTRWSSFLIPSNIYVSLKRRNIDIDNPELVE